ncbi:TonB-dependent receptor [Carboxylicivirga sediminis]|uniref:TonB-dependent receptor n=1 Tax=Carboxylicivirga sediminis TaxID=2006564 RepID=A0A941IVP8_9BACT|nr:TonB-dependent receptor [Carboxylicivirga sediminis]MBR8535261.1 TonB-dependent receptor [Carboxylicivirga sediminis]
MKKNHFIPLVIVILYTLLPTITHAQTQIRGSITDTLSNAIAFANIIILDSKNGGVSDANGHFSFSTTNNLPFQLQASSIGFHTSTIEVKDSVEAQNIRITLRVKQENLNAVNIEGQIADQSFSKIDPKLANRLPDAGGGNIEGLIKSQMGVSSNNELSSQYRVRGGNYDENLIYVNDIEIYRPFLIRSGQQEGLSFVNPNLISSLKFSPGGFEAQYGDKMASVLDVRYKKPQSLSGSMNASLLGASGHIEGTSKDQRFTAITGIRYKTNQYLLGTLDVSGDYNPSFFDVQTFLTYQLSDRWQLEALGYYSQNNYEFEPVDRETSFGTINEAKKLKIYFEGQEKDVFQTGLGAVALKFNPNGDNQYKITTMGYRTYEEVTYDILGQYWLQNIENQDGSTPNPQEDGIQNIGVGTNLEHARNDLLGIIQNIALQGKQNIGKHLFSWEVKYQHEYFKDYINEWEMRDSADYSLPHSDKEVKLVYSYKADHETSSNRVTSYVQDAFKLYTNDGFLLVNAGIRTNYWDFSNEFLISPRINLLYYPNSTVNTRYRLAGGIYYQSPLYREMRRPDGTINEQIKAQKSVQIVGGFDRIFEAMQREFKFTTEAYYKHLTNLNPYQVDNVRIRYSGTNNAKGYATGIDFKLHGEFVPGVESWANLSLMKTEEDILDDYYTETDIDGNETIIYPGYIPRPSDQRFSFSLFFQDYLPNNPDFRVNLNLLYTSGLPFGPPQSPRYMAVNRMPAYRRVDIGFSKDLTKWFNKNNNIVKDCWVSLEVFNLFDISNTISYYWVSDIYNRQYAVPNYLTSRRLNLKFSIMF